MTEKMRRVSSAGLAAFTFAVALALVGCSSEGDDGAQEPQGEQEKTARTETVSSSLMAAPGVCTSGEIFCGCIRRCNPWGCACDCTGDVCGLHPLVP
jgi:hypothetical protein